MSQPTTTLPPVERVLIPVEMYPPEEVAALAVFQRRQREAGVYAASALIPEHLRGKVADVMIAMEMARLLGEAPLIVMQAIHVVSGKAGFSAQYMIARANASGIFKGRIDWRLDKSDASNLKVTAFATLKDTGQEVSVEVDMRMADAEGWTKNPKYKSMPEVMLRYRSAAFLVRFYAPDVMLGYQSTEEIEDVGVARGPDLTAVPLSSAMLIEQAAPAAQAEPEPSQTLAEELNDEIPDRKSVV